MKRIIYIISVLTLVILFSFALSSCGGDEETEDYTLNVYNWGEYISDGSLGTLDVNAEFEKYCKEELGLNVNVIYSTYATNEDMYSKILSGAGSMYDIVIPSDYTIQKMITAGLLHSYDVSELPNYQYIDDDFKGLYFDPENRYSVPYTYGTVGVIYNSTMVDPEDIEDESWDLLFNEKYKGKILQFNNPRDGLATAMFKLGLDINSTDKADWDQALALLAEQKPIVQAYVSDEIYNKMISNSASIAAYYVGDYISMTWSNPDLAFYYPKEGTNVFVDSMCILESSKNKELAKEYINFMLSEEIAIANATYIGYASPNSLVYENEDYAEEMGEDAMEVLYGSSDSVNKNYPYDPFYHDYTPEMQEYTNMLWETLKTQNSTEAWVHIASIAIVVGAGAFIGYDIYIKKKRSRDYRLRDRQRNK
ncbi:MAG: extracellular solute-binding protein [Clostridia bacterium]|nr:extracellular solute-binding protein [Clostridia bacterium]